MQRKSIERLLKKDEEQVATALKQIEEGSTFVSIHVLLLVTHIATDWMQQANALLNENERLHATILGQNEAIREQTRKVLESHSKVKQLQAENGHTLQKT